METEVDVESDKYLNLSDLVVFDSETTAASKNEPISLSFLDGVSGMREWFLKPTEKMLPCAICVHGITDKEASLYPPQEEVIDDIWEYVEERKDKVWLGYNIEFDFKVISDLFLVHSKTPPPFSRVLDLMRLAKKMYPIADVGSYSMDTVFVYTLPEKLEYFMESRREHSSCKDVQLTLRLAVAMLKRLYAEKEILGYDAVMEFMSEPVLIEHFPFGKHKGRPITEVVQTDRSYIMWVLKQDWAKKDYPDLVYTIGALGGKK